MGEIMKKKTALSILSLCVCCAGGGASAQNPWDNAIRSFPEIKIADFTIKEHGGSGCKPKSAESYICKNNAGDIDVTTTVASSEGVSVATVDPDMMYAPSETGCVKFSCNTTGSTCPDGTVVAVAGSAVYSDPNTGTSFPFTVKNAWLKCVVSGVFDEWEVLTQSKTETERPSSAGKIPDCPNDPYKIFRGKPNTTAYLRDFTVSRNEVFKTISYPSVSDMGDSLCVTYTCAPGTKPTADIENLPNPEYANIECVTKNKQCGMYESGATSPSDYAYSREYKVAKCNSDTYHIYDTQNGTFGEEYIKWLRDDINKQITKNNETVLALYNSNLDVYKRVFACANGVCSLSEDMLDAAETECQFLCTDTGFKVRLNVDSGLNGQDVCPRFFKYTLKESSDGQYKYTCVFTPDVAQKALNKAATDAKEKCATAICRASNGTYKNNKCMCGNDECTSTTSVNGTPYTYCGGNGIKDGKDLKDYYYCGQNEKGTKRLAEGLPSNFDNTAAFNEAINAAKQSCITNNATDDAANNDAESISDLAKTLDEIEDAYGLSKWRTVDGKFNYARLASDATAAVVLGTTGALVTSSVVKKKQVEAGFESLECTVGGQHVGDWGDVFRIDGK